MPELAKIKTIITSPTMRASTELSGSANKMNTLVRVPLACRGERRLSRERGCAGNGQ